jgi:uncharacterized membrane protein
MMEGAIGLFALGYSGLVLFGLAASFRRLYAPRRAAWTAFLVSCVVHGATTLMAGEHMALALAFWGIPHLLLLPLLLMAARRQEEGSAR